MSINIITQPAAISGQSLLSANNPSTFVVADYTLSGQTDFMYVGDVYCGAQKVVTQKSYPDNSYGYGVFDLGKVANKFVSYNFPGNASDEGTSGIHLAPDSCKVFSVNFREQYMNVSGVFTQPSGVTASGSYYYTNAALSFSDSAVNQTLNNYLMSTTHQGKFLQSRASTNNIVSLDAPKTLRQWLYFFNYTNATGPWVHIVTYNAAGTQVGHYTIVNPSPTTTGVKYVSTGYPQLAALTGYTTVAGSTTILGGTVTSYAVNVTYSATDNTTSVCSDTFLYTIKDECTKFADTYSVYWLNALGGFDSMRFAYKNQTTYSKSQTPYRKIQGKLNSDGSYTRNAYDPSTINFFTEVTESIELNSDWLSDTQCTNLKHLFSSPVVFIENSSGVVQACTIKDDDYPLHRRVNGPKAYSLQINVTLSSSSYRQLL